MSIISENLKELKDVEFFSEIVEVLKKVEMKKDNKMQYKISKRVLKIKNNSIILLSKWITKDKVHCNLCLKHARFTKVNSHIISIKESDRCRSLFDPLGNEILIRFKSLSNVLFFEQELTRLNKQLSETYNQLKADIYVINEVNDGLGKFIVNINGTMNGEQMKKMAEERFNMPGLLSLRYSLEIQNGEKIVSVIDEMPIFYLNEYLSGDKRPMFCSAACKHSPSPPKKAITLIVLDQTNRERKNFKPDKKCRRTKEGIDVMYNIEDRWKGDLIPTWLMRLLSDIYYHGRNFLGIFRISAAVTNMRSCYEHMLMKDDFIIDDNIHLKANVLKMFLMKVEDGLLKLSDENDIEYLISGIESSSKFIDNPAMENKLMSMLRAVPRQRFFFLQHLLIVLKTIADSDETRMNAFNLGTTFSPAIFNTVQYRNIESTVKSLQLSVLTECMILLVDKIVDVDTRQKIENAFDKYKSQQLTPIYSESPTVSWDYEPSSSATTTPRKYHDKMSINDFDESTNEDQENRSLSFDDASDRITIPSRSRILMGSKLLEKMSTSVNDKSPIDIIRESDEPIKEERKSVVKSVEKTTKAPLVVKRKNPCVTPKTSTPSGTEICGNESLLSPSVTSTRHSSLMGTSVTSHRRQMSNRQVPGPIITENHVKRTSSRKLGVNQPELAPKNDRSRSPFVKKMVKIYERRMQGSPSKSVERKLTQKSDDKKPDDGNRDN